MKTTVVLKFKAEIECVWQYSEDPKLSPFSIPNLGQLQPGTMIPYNWQPVSLKVVQE